MLSIEHSSLDRFDIIQREQRHFYSSENGKWRVGPKKRKKGRVTTAKTYMREN